MIRESRTRVVGGRCIIFIIMVHDGYVEYSGDR